MPTNETIKTKIVTGKVRFSYVHVWEPTAIQEGQDKKYSVSILIPKKDKKTIAMIEDAIDALVEQVKAKNNGKLPKKFTTPLKDGDEERPEDAAYADCMYVNASSKQQPGIVDADKDEILNKSEFYSGCYGRASFNLYLFDKAGNQGIAAGLNNLMKTEDGESLGGRSSASEDFED